MFQLPAHYTSGQKYLSHHSAGDEEESPLVSMCFHCRSHVNTDSCCASSRYQTAADNYVGARVNPYFKKNVGHPQSSRRSLPPVTVVPPVSSASPIAVSPILKSVTAFVSQSVPYLVSSSDMEILPVTFIEQMRERVESLFQSGASETLSTTLGVSPLRPGSYPDPSESRLSTCLDTSGPRVTYSPAPLSTG